MSSFVIKSGIACLVVWGRSRYHPTIEQKPDDPTNQLTDARPPGRPTRRPGRPATPVGRAGAQSVLSFYWLGLLWFDPRAPFCLARGLYPGRTGEDEEEEFDEEEKDDEEEEGLGPACHQTK